MMSPRIAILLFAAQCATAAAASFHSQCAAAEGRLVQHLTRFGETCADVTDIYEVDFSAVTNEKTAATCADNEISEGDALEICQVGALPSSYSCRPSLFVRANINRVTCPVMAALLINCDLVPDRDGFVTKQEAFDALISIGVREETAQANADDNFDHVAPDEFPELKRLNLFEMKSTQPQQPHEAIRHFRTTGIRVGPFDDFENGDILNRGFNRAELAFFLNANTDGLFTLWEALKAASIWDIESPHDINTLYALVNELSQYRPSSGVNEEVRPPGCAPSDSVSIEGFTGSDGKANMTALENDPCFSRLHQSVADMHMEFGTPQGEDAVLTQVEMRELWFNGVYPAGVVARKAALQAS